MTDERPEFPSANVAAFSGVADILETSLGPSGMQKLLSNDGTESETSAGYAVTSDGATVLENLPSEHPVWPVLERLTGPHRPGDTGVEAQDVPDGVKTSVLLTTRLLERATELVTSGTPPTRAVDGYRRAHRRATSAIASSSRLPGSFEDPERVVEAAARSAATSAAPLPPETAADAAEITRTVDTVDHRTLNVHTTSGGETGDTRLVHGAILPRTDAVHPEMPMQVADASLLVVEGHEAGGLADPDTPDDVVYTPSDPDAAAELSTEWSREKSETVGGFVDLGVDVVATRLGVDDDYGRLLADAGLLAVEGLTALDVRRLALATGASPVSTVDDVDPGDLGFSGEVSVELGDRYPGRWKRRRTTFFDGCRDPGSMAYVVYGAPDYLDGDLRRDVLKAAQAASRARDGVVPGGGAVHLDAAAAAREGADYPADQAYADAAEDVASALARNQGMDPVDAVPTAKAARGDDFAAAFVDGEVVDPWEAGVVDPLETVEEAYVKAFDVVRTVLLVDDALDATFESEPTDPDDTVHDDVAEAHRDD